MSATRYDLPVLAGLKAPRMARPLRASALTPAARREDFAIVAGISRGDTPMREDASPSALAKVRWRPDRKRPVKYNDANDGDADGSTGAAGSVVPEVSRPTSRGVRL